MKIGQIDCGVHKVTTQKDSRGLIIQIHKIAIALVGLLLIINLSLNAQKKTVCGYIFDAFSGEALIGATVVSTNQLSRTYTNNYGFFSLNTISDSIVVSYVGYQSKKISVLKGDTCLNLVLNSWNEIREVKVTGHGKNYGISGISELSMKTIQSLPVIAGEKDILKSFQTLPGVQGGVEGTSGLIVRGGSPDQNLILIDGVTVYNVNHLFGIFSVFNADAINTAVLYKGYIPPRFGGRVSSVLDITMKEGNRNSFHGNISLGLISSKFVLEDNVNNHKTTWFLSARRTYIDLLLRPFIKNMADGAIIGYHFYDVNVKVSHLFNQNHKLYFSFYSGRDKYSSEYDFMGKNEEGLTFSENSNESLLWGNLTGTLRWNWLINPRTFSNITLIASDYKMLSNNSYSQQINDSSHIAKNTYDIEYQSGIRDLSVKWDVECSILPMVKIESGISYSSFLFKPDNNISSVSNMIDYNTIDTSVTKLYGTELAAYFNTQCTLWNNLILNAGMRINSFFVDNKKYFALEPRINLNWNLNKELKFSMAYCQTGQNIHLLTRSNMGLPNDTWLPSTTTIKPVVSKQYSCGFEKSFRNTIYVSTELFLKKMNNISEFKDGASYLWGNSDWQNRIEQGSGRAYGIEFMVEKKTGVWNAWVSYTLSKSVRQFITINHGQEFPYKYNRRHYITLVALFKPKKNVDLSASWVLSSGFWATLVTEKYYSAIDNYGNYFPDISNYGTIEHIESRNNFRTPAYHRLDIGINLHKQRKKFTRTLSLGVYNAYFKYNPLYIKYTNDGFKMISIVPFLPYINYSIEF